LSQKVAFKTLGCKVNQSESNGIIQKFIENNYEITEFNKKADIYIINTCSVTGEADRKSRQMIRKAIRLNPQAVIIITGCGVQSNLSNIYEIANKKTIIVSNFFKEKIFSIFNSLSKDFNDKLVYYKPAMKINTYPENKCLRISQRIRAFVKIQDGCNQFCSYCIIPYLRGKSRSRSPYNITQEIKSLALNGYKEIVLIGINLGNYGSDYKEKINLTKLINKIENINSIERIRLSSIELPYITDELINKLFHSTKVCKHLHIPLQSGSDKILKLMRRSYTTSQFEKTIKKIREKNPDIAITTDIIVGFPGENNYSFQETIKFAREMKFSKIHIFPYSERPFNLASFFPYKNESKTIKERCKKMIDLTNNLHLEFLKKNIEKEKNILIENREFIDDYSINHGLTDNYIKTRIIDKENILRKGQIIRVRLKKIVDDYVIGKII